MRTHHIKSGNVLRSILIIALAGIPTVSANAGWQEGSSAPKTKTRAKVISGGVLNGKAISLPQPVYPAVAKAAHASGTVTVQTTVGEAGDVISAVAVSGHPMLRAASVSAARQAKFSPTKLEGVPVKVTGTLIYNFVLPKEESPESPPRVASTNANVLVVPPGATVGSRGSLSPVGDEEVLNAKAISLPRPTYPRVARDAHVSGSVEVQVTIGEEGDVIFARAVSGHPLLRASAVEAARGARFSPTTLSGVPVKVSGVMLYRFGSDEMPPTAASGPAAISATEQNPPCESNANVEVNLGILTKMATSLPRPGYPPPARAAHAKGVVMVLVMIGMDGSVTSAKAVSGHELLRPAAEAAARGAKFRPTYLGGEAVKVVGSILYNFVGDDAPAVERCLPNAEPVSIEAGTLNELATSLPMPVYPAVAKAAHASGTVTIRVIVDEEGKVVEATGVSGHPLLRAAALAAAKNATIAPAQINGSPVKVSGLLLYEFIAD
jgi:TonB family protein